ncbi:MAG TPA: DotU family type VI secretion system protein [Telluria sp.]|jgi:type VI secretion system protein ImpK
MSTDDPFSLPDPERTIILPTPGARPAPQQAAHGATADDLAHQAPAASGLNALVAAANPLLDVVAQLRAAAHHPDPAALRDALAQAVRHFETRAQAAGVRPENIIAARYALCTLLDEAASATPWGGSGTWARHSLLVMFHNEAWGGEKFFQLLSKLAQTPGANRDLLELLYVCLALGFKGRYQVQHNGKQALDSVRERLAQLLRAQRGDYERALSPRWQGAAGARQSLFTALPLWIALGGLGLLSAGAYFAFSYVLNEQSDPVYARIQALQPNTAAPSPRAPPASRPRLAAPLAPDIAAGMVEVRDEAGRSVVILRGDGLFAPGSATVSAGYGPTLQRIARALDTLPGPVRVIGHTDAQPIRSPRFPSNWHLSQARAQAVAAQLAVREQAAARYSAEGRADAEPLGPNDTPEQRTRNRRVEIVLFPSAPGG